MNKTIALTLLALFALTPAYAAERTFPTTVTKQDIQEKYLWAGQGGEKVKVLVMPGHEPFYGGAENNGLRERDIVVSISDALATELKKDPRLEVTVARDTLAWNPELADYFETEWKDIQKFVKEKKRAMQRAMRTGDLEDRSFEVAHNTAATDVALRLYGINKWAAEEGYDIVIHPHLNDNVGATNHSGFAVYIPDAQFGNAEASRPLGEAIAAELNAFNASSTLPIENYAVVEDQDLIALGSYNTADFAVALIEYAYIYESKIEHPEARGQVLADMARQTSLGIEKYLGGAPTRSNTVALPHTWELSSMPLQESSPQTYALQVALHKLGFYPPAGELLIGCPISGYMGECTARALKAFQASKGLEQTGTIGPRTKAALEAAGF